MHLPYSRPRLLEFHDQSWCPPYFRDPTVGHLSFLWKHRILPVQPSAPYEIAADVLEGLVKEIEDEDERLGVKEGEEGGRLRIVDFCSGAGGPMPAIEKRINQKRKARALPPTQVMLSDLHPQTKAYESLKQESPSQSLSYFPHSVDATRAPEALKKQRHLRTFCLAFHHFGEDGARRVLEDAMRSSEGICIFELQGPDFGSFLTVLLLFPVALLITPFQRPSLVTLFWTYIIPIVPFILSFDGVISAYRTYTFPHLTHLANAAAVAVSLESAGKEEVDWRWEEGEKIHTWPIGKIRWIVGRRDRRGDEAGMDGLESRGRVGSGEYQY